MKREGRGENFRLPFVYNKNSHTDGQTDRQIGRQTDRQTDKQTDGQPNIRKEKE